VFSYYLYIGLLGLAILIWVVIAVTAGEGEPDDEG
jgi:hypothetical protein